MPEIARFYGIVIQMYFGDHPPPHFHAIYGCHKAGIDIQTLARIDGLLSPRARGLVIEWATIHQQELCQAFQKAVVRSDRQDRTFGLISTLLALPSWRTSKMNVHPRPLTVQVPTTCAHRACMHN